MNQTEQDTRTTNIRCLGIKALTSCDVVLSESLSSPCAPPDPHSSLLRVPQELACEVSCMPGSLVENHGDAPVSYTHLTLPTKA